MIFGIGKRSAVIIEMPDTGEVFSVDCTFSINQERTANITQHPVESGGTVADHRDKSPRNISISGVISDLHIGRALTIFDQTGNADYHKVFRERMLSADDNDELITVDCGDRGYFERYLLADLNMPVEPGQGRAVHFSMTLQKVPVVSPKIRMLGVERIERARLQAREDAKKDLGATTVDNKATVQRWSAGENRGLSTPQAASGAASSIGTSVATGFGT